jgi:hypothetical protein
MKIFLIVFCYVLFVSFSFSDEKWVLAKEQDGIKVYTADVPGYKYDKSIALYSFNSDINSFCNFAMKPLNYKKFSERIERIDIIKTTDTKVVYYMSIDMPWPIYNRDGVYELSIKSKSSSKAHLIIRARPDYLPVQKGYIRIKHANTDYIVKTEGDKLHLRYEKHTDPNGNIPAWLSNYYLSDAPIENIMVMKKNIEK